MNEKTGIPDGFFFNFDSSCKIQVIIILFFIITVNFGCSSGGSDGGGGGVTPHNAVTIDFAGNASVGGYVYVVGTITPVSGVLVTIDGVTDTTDANGEYLLNNIPTGLNTITAQKSDYENYSYSFNVQQGNNNYDIHLTASVQTASVDGVVTSDCSSTPVSGALVTIGGLTDTTDSTGHYQLPSVPQGNQKITIKKNGYYEFESSFYLYSSDKTFNAELDCIDYFDTITNSYGMTFSLIPAGTFMMGASPGSICGSSQGHDQTRHEVTLTKDFFMQTTEVTQGQWQAINRWASPDYDDCGIDCPIIGVSRYLVQEFIDRLNALDDGNYRLPTEAEWEYAARAGSTTDLANGAITVTENGRDPNLDAIGWYFYNSATTPKPVAQKDANAWGLYDFHGNAREWVQDKLGPYPTSPVTDPTGPAYGSGIVRGGSADDDACDCTSFSRTAADSWSMMDNGPFGFRLVREP